MAYVLPEEAAHFLSRLEPDSVDLFLLDPPYFGIVQDSWDNAWATEDDYVSWLVDLLERALNLLAEHGSLVIFAGIGKHGSHPILRVIQSLELLGYTFRNWITWQKRRAYGKSHDYLFCREEILWFSKSPERTRVRFNVPLLNEKRGYAAAKSDFKRVSNVWNDIPELMQPERTAQKPEPLIGRLVETHSNVGDMIVDFFAGWGTTGIAALRRSRRFFGCEAKEQDAMAADARCAAIVQGLKEGSADATSYR